MRNFEATDRIDRMISCEYDLQVFLLKFQYKTYFCCPRFPRYDFAREVAHEKYTLMLHTVRRPGHLGTKASTQMPLE